MWKRVQILLLGVAVIGGAQGGAVISVETGSSLPVVEFGGSPTLTVSNTLARAVDWTVSVCGDDGFGHTFQVPSVATNAPLPDAVRSPRTATLPVGGVCRIPLPASLAKGVWQLAVEVREGSNEVCKDERRFAVLDPHPVTPRLPEGVFRMGIHVHCGRLPLDVSDRIVEAVTRAGAKMVRTDYGFMFSDVYPKGPDAPQWDRADRLMADFKAHGLSSDIIIYGTPAWARIPELAAAKGRGECGVRARREIAASPIALTHHQACRPPHAVKGMGTRSQKTFSLAESSTM